MLATMGRLIGSEALDGMVVSRGGRVDRGFRFGDMFLARDWLSAFFPRSRHPLRLVYGRSGVLVNVHGFRCMGPRHIRGMVTGGCDPTHRFQEALVRQGGHP